MEEGEEGWGESVWWWGDGVQGRRIPGELGLDYGRCILHGGVLLVVKLVSFGALFRRSGWMLFVGL